MTTTTTPTIEAEMRLATMKTTENGTKQFIVWHGTRAVSCYRDDVLDIWKARLYVNCRNEQLGDATLTTRDHLTRKQATEWAKATVAWRLPKHSANC